MARAVVIEYANRVTSEAHRKHHMYRRTFLRFLAALPAIILARPALAKAKTKPAYPVAALHDENHTRVTDWVPVEDGKAVFQVTRTTRASPVAWLVVKLGPDRCTTYGYGGIIAIAGDTITMHLD